MFSSKELPPRQLLVLDLDENLVSVKFSADAKRDLSASAELHLDPVSITNVSLFMPVPASTPDTVINAISKTEWISVFEKVIAVNERYRQLAPNDPIPLIAVKILTTSLYDRGQFMDHVFSKIYGETITTKLFDHQSYYYYNRKAFKALPLVDGKPILDGKGGCMFYYYPAWQEELPGLTLDRVYLIDDSCDHIASAREFGFSAIHHPTNPYNRTRDTSYTKEKDGVFEQLQAIVTTAEKYCEELTPASVERKRSSPALN